MGLTMWSPPESLVRLPVTVRLNSGADVGTRSRLNFVEGDNVTLEVVDDVGQDEVEVTVSATGGGGGVGAGETDPLVFMGGF